MKIISIKWLQALDTEEVNEAIDEACVDCYGEDEQCSALVDLAAQELAFPFPATVMGEAVEVVDTASSKYHDFQVIEAFRVRQPFQADLRCYIPLPPGAAMR